MIIDQTNYNAQYYKNKIDKYLKKNWKKIAILTFIGLPLFFLAKKYIDKKNILEFSNYIAQLGPLGNLILVFFGILAVNIGLPILTYEMGMGYIIQNTWLAIFLAIFAKITGTALNIFLARKYFRQTVQEKIQQTKIYKALRKLQQQQARKSLFLLAILEAPMLFKNFFIAVFNYKHVDICTMYYPISMVYSMWYVILGSEMGDFVNPNSEHNFRSKVIFYIMLSITALTVVYVTIITKRIMGEEDEISNVKKHDDEYETEELNINYKSSFGNHINQQHCILNQNGAHLNQTTNNFIDDQGLNNRINIDLQEQQENNLPLNNIHNNFSNTIKPSTNAHNISRKNSINKQQQNQSKKNRFLHQNPFQQDNAKELSKTEIKNQNQNKDNLQQQNGKNSKNQQNNQNIQISIQA